jgi:signal transduction histidine kinase/CheY-like chemotaxis protein
VTGPFEAIDPLAGLRLERPREVAAEGSREQIGNQNASERAAWRAAERSAERLLRMHEIAARLAPTLAEPELFEVMVAAGMEITGAHTGVLGLSRPALGVVEIVHAKGYTPERRARFQSIPLDADYPLTRAIATGEPEWLPDIGSYARAYPMLVHIAPPEPTALAIATIPIVGASGTLGAMALVYDESRDFLPEDRALLMVLGRLCGQALERARLQADLLRARAATEMRAHWTRLLADASRAFAEAAIDLRVLFDRIAAKVVESFAHACAIRVVAGDGIHLTPVAVRGDADCAFFAHATARNVSLTVDTEPYATALRTCKPVFSDGELLPPPGLSPEERPAFAAFVEERRRFAHMLVPLRSRGRLLGTLGIIRYGEGVAFTADERLVLEELADRAALAIDNGQLLAASEEANRRKDQFLAMLAHELRNPMAPILSALGLLRMPEAPAATHERARCVIERQVRHMARLVDDLLEVSRISRGKIELRRERVDLVPLVREVVADAAEAGRAVGVTVTSALPEGAIVAFADRTRVAQVLANLLGNALKFTPRGGGIAVALREAEGGVELCVADTGIGIQAPLLESIFEPFTQEDRSLDRSRGGLGLGLSVVKGLVELHGGRVAAASAGAGQGATFRVWLPPAQAPSEAPARVEPLLASNPRARRVLVVDDNRDAADMLRDLLVTEGHEVQVVYDGDAAIAAARSFGPDVLLCDLGLPGKDGFAVAEALRSDAATARVRLVAVSGYGGAEDRKRSQAAGFDAHLTKPVDMEALGRVLA